ncbi:hypothetical protein MKW98_020676 [Papaver atlanticum]|uniref:Neprosin PEP catalytic domain-containing protein n=1 Tax=Papaver atlanticum TaxID=357466 RepID=A0AAD4TF29_9MAGN|nr:hypothetical protein MKW98_020676 [Papaver atlanticum]
MKYSNVSFIVLFVLISFILAAKTKNADGKRSSVSIEEEEDIAFERQLKNLNKKPIKTIMTKYGDTVDCINIHKQPAFDHPLLKDHKIQMVPSFIQEETTSNNISASSYRVSNIDNGFQNERCPPGTVPIRRTKKQDLANARYLLQKKINPNRTNSYSSSPMNYHFVSVEELSQGKSYHGAAALISTHTLELTYKQFSTAQVWIENGPEEEKNSIQFGWLAYPAIFEDSHSRLMGYWTVDGGKQTGCFNVLCYGFVQVHDQVFLGAVIEQISIYGKLAYNMVARVYRDRTGNWWLMFNVIIGYWPAEIFTHLDNASVVRYGGIAGAEPQTDTPPMGNGYLPQLQDYTKTAFIRKMKYIDDKGQLQNINPDGVQSKHDAKLDCYNILFAGNLGSDWEMSMTYGGPGGMCS